MNKALKFTVRGIIGTMILVFLLSGCKNLSGSGSSSASSDIPSESFDLIDANHRVPSDILEEVAYFPKGGGPNTCSLYGSYYDQPTIIPVNDKPVLELTDVYDFLGCGFRSSDPVEVVITLPDGSEFRDTLSPEPSYDIEGNYEVEGSYRLGADIRFISGTYKVVIKQNSIATENSFRVGFPSAPRVYQTGNTLLLINFHPNERIRLFAYQWLSNGEKLRFMGWKEYKVGEKGALTIRVNTDAVYFVIGDETGEVHVRIYSRWKDFGNIRR